MTELIPFPHDYADRVYAGVLGKIIGVYLGRPFEGWSHERIIAELGEVDHYVNEKFGEPLVVTDDDIAGTFTFLRSLEDNGYDPDLSPAEIGDAWLNYLIESRTILWWGGLGMSTEHTAYMRLKNGIRAPQSGSITTNGKTIAEQIGSQIFIDGWAMLFPGDPERAVDFARRAASVSHDGEAIYGAQVVAALEAMAFAESDVNTLLDTAVTFIPADSTIAKLIGDIRTWHAQDADWYDTLHRIQGQYGYDKYGGACHMVPNHALIIHALLHGNDDFQRSLMIANTSGWDTDCNSGNVGAILGIKNGLAGIDASRFDWRGPVADRMYLSSAEGGRAITDAAIETSRIVNTARKMEGLKPITPKDGARFHFSLPGSVHGFTADDESTLTVGNTDGQLALTLAGTQPGIVTTPTFIPPEAIEMRGYTLYASPTLHSGQSISATISAMSSNDGEVFVTAVIHVYGERDEVQTIEGPTATLAPGQESSINWTVPDTDRLPIMSVGFRLDGSPGAIVRIDCLDWKGAPTVELGRPSIENSMWRRGWVDGVDLWAPVSHEKYLLSQNSGTGLISQSSEDWIDYSATVTVTIPLASSAGITARVGGMRRYVALVLENDGFARLISVNGTRTVLAETPFLTDPDRAYTLTITLSGSSIEGIIDGATTLHAKDATRPVRGGGIGLVITEGTLSAGPVSVRTN